MNKLGRLALAAAALAGMIVSALGQEVSNLAASANGGHVVFFSSQYDDSVWRVDNLLISSADKGWAGASAGPQSVVIGFQDNRLALIEDVLINPYTRENSKNWAKDVEFQVSTTYPFRDFRTVGNLTLSNEGQLQLLSLPEPAEARYVKIRFLSNYGGSYMEAGEVRIMGRLVDGSPPAPVYSNLAAAEGGAVIERYTSQYDDSGWAVANLLKPDGGGQWAGSSAASQEVVVALPETVDVGAVSIDNYARENPNNWAREIEVEISPSSPYKDFSPAGKATLPAIGDLHTLTLAAPTRTRYVKVLFRSNHGGSYMEAARIRVFHTPGMTANSPRSLDRQLQEEGKAVIHEIHFAVNSAEILQESASVLNEIVDALKKSPEMSLIIEGHTDNVGGADFNLELSRRRAESVKRWLVDRGGIEELRLTTAGYGLTRPLADNSTDSGRAQNRRVELRVKN